MRFHIWWILPASQKHLLDYSVLLLFILKAVVIYSINLRNYIRNYRLMYKNQGKFIDI